MPSGIETPKNAKTIEVAVDDETNKNVPNAIFNVVKFSLCLTVCDFPGFRKHLQKLGAGIRVMNNSPVNRPLDNFLF
jgi:hypothetical protein